MARIELAPEVGEDLERILSHLAEHESDQGAQRIEAIIAALDVLASNPEMGRRVRGEFRELVIGRERKGYLALYQYLSEADLVLVLAIRAQRESAA